MYVTVIFSFGMIFFVLGLLFYIMSSQTPNQTPESKKTNEIFAYTLMFVGSFVVFGTFFATKKQKFFPNGIPITTFTKRLKPEFISGQI